MRGHQTVESYIIQTGADKPITDCCPRSKTVDDQMIDVGMHTICSVMKYIETI